MANPAPPSLPGLTRPFGCNSAPSQCPCPCQPQSGVLLSFSPPTLPPGGSVTFNPSGSGICTLINPLDAQLCSAPCNWSFRNGTGINICGVSLSQNPGGTFDITGTISLFYCNSLIPGCWTCQKNIHLTNVVLTCNAGNRYCYPTIGPSIKGLLSGSVNFTVDLVTAQDPHCAALPLPMNFTLSV